MTDPNRRLEHAIKQLGADLEPPPGWEARVLAAVEPAAVRRRWWARGWLAIPAVAAMALVLALLPKGTRREAGPLALSAELVDGSREARGPSAIRAVARDGKGHRAIWIYRDHELVAQCPGHPACHSDGDALSLVLDVPVGSYQIIALSSEAALPAATGSRERDLEAATAAGGTWKLKELDVR